MSAFICHKQNIIGPFFYMCQHFENYIFRNMDRMLFVRYHFEIDFF